MYFFFSSIPKPVVPSELHKAEGTLLGSSAAIDGSLKDILIHARRHAVDSDDDHFDIDNDEQNFCRINSLLTT